MLFQKLKWTKGTTFPTFAEIYERYVQYSRENITVVFDSYCENSTKDMIHRRRKCYYCTDIVPSRDEEIDSENGVIPKTSSGS